MRFIPTLALFCLAALPAAAGWSVTQDGTALIENAGHASLALRCDNNVNTGNKPSWRLELAMTGLPQNLGPQVEMKFQFPGRHSLTVLGEHRLGKIYYDGMEHATQSDINAIISRLKSASAVTVSLTNASSGAVSDEATFGLTGSSKAIRTIAKACQ